MVSKARGRYAYNRSIKHLFAAASAADFGQRNVQYYILSIENRKTIFGVEGKLFGTFPWDSLTNGGGGQQKTFFFIVFSCPFGWKTKKKKNNSKNKNYDFAVLKREKNVLSHVFLMYQTLKLWHLMIKACTILSTNFYVFHNLFFQTPTLLKRIKINSTNVSP